MKQAIFFMLLCFGVGILLGVVLCAEEPIIKPHAVNAFDTTLSGMHYTIYTEPRTGDLVVVNQTIDSLKVQMYKSQIK